MTLHIIDDKPTELTEAQWERIVNLKPTRRITDSRQTVGSDWWEMWLEMWREESNESD